MDDIIVFQPNGGPNADGYYGNRSNGHYIWVGDPAGHVSVVAWATYVGNGKWNVGVKGANQGGSTWDAGCTNVNTLQVDNLYYGSGAAFYHYGI